MSMDTDKLIAQLGRDLKPVKPLAGAGTLALILASLSLAATFGAIEIFTKGIRSDWQVMFGAHLCQTAGIFAAGVLAAYAAFKLSVPDTRIRTPERVILGLASFIWVLLIAGQIGAEPPKPGYRNCLTDFSLLFIIPFAAGVFMTTRAAPVWYGWAGYALALSVGSFSALGMRFACPNEQPAHLLVWHYLPVLGFAIVGIALGQILLKKFAKK
ncbi:MAG: DUF1109 family protein [Alphaproteobacteria bacterium]|nr:DUF1109 family protein [Alphaproteobacteria bacterium]